MPNMHKNAHKFDWKTRSKIACDYTRLLHGRICPSWRCILSIFELFFEHARGMLWPGQWMSEWVRDVHVCTGMSYQPDWICYMYMNQISCFKGNTVWEIRYSWEQPYFFVYKRDGSILGFLQHFLWVWLRILRVGLIIIWNWIIRQRNIVFGI